MQMSSSRLRSMTEADLGQVLAWRNHPDVRRYMFSTEEIPLANHIAWFEKASKQTDRHLLIYEQDSEPMGFLNIHEIAAGGIADWGFYAAPCAPRGTGREMGRAALAFAFNEIGLSKICGDVLAYNERSMSFHMRLGFKQEGVLRQQHYDGQSYHDVVCFGLLANEYLHQS